MDEFGNAVAEMIRAFTEIVSTAIAFIIGLAVLVIAVLVMVAAGAAAAIAKAIEVVGGYISTYRKSRKPDDPDKTDDP